MVISSIHDWLRTNGEFQKGVTLLKLHGSPSAADLFLFSLPEAPMSRTRLAELLRAINAITPEDVVVATGTPAPDPIEDRALQLSINQEPPREVPEEALPAALRPLRRDLTEWHKEMTLLRGMMMSTPDGMELRRIALEVHDLHERLRAGWTTIERWRRTGKLPAQKVQIPRVDRGDLILELRAITVWISQRTKGSRKCTQEQMKVKQDRKAEVQNLLKNAAADR